MQSPLFETLDIRDGIRLYHLQSAKWKTEVVKLVFAGRLDDLVASRALSAYLARHGHHRLRGMDTVARALEDLYGATFSAFPSKLMNRHLFTVKGMAVSKAFVPGRLDPLKKVVGMIDRVLARPFLGESEFAAETFEREQRNLLRAIDAIADNKAQYSEQRLIEEMFSGHPFSTPAYGQREDVEKSTLEDVRAAYRSTVENTPLFVMSVGPRSLEEMGALIAKELTLSDRSSFRRRKVELPPIRKRPRKFAEQDDLAQARLAMGFRIDGYDRRRDGYAAIMADSVFGSSGICKLFKVIRERHGLAYSIGSSVDTISGSVFVTAGVDGANVKKTTDMTRKIVKEVAAGKVSDVEMSVALSGIRKSLEGLGDSQDALMNFQLGLILGGRKEKDPEAVRKRYEKVKVADMADIFGRLKLDTVFQLEPRDGEVS